MNKQELVAAVAAETSMPKKCVEAVLKSIVGNVVAEVAKKGKVQMIGFGTFEARERAARTGKNPQNGKPIKIAASTVPAFKAGLNRLKKVKNNTWLPARCRNAAGFFVGITALFMSRNRPRLCLMLCVLWYFETTGGLTKSKD